MSNVKAIELDAHSPHNSTSQPSLHVTGEDYHDDLYERRVLGWKLPAYFDRHPERKLVRKLDTYIL